MQTVEKVKGRSLTQLAEALEKQKADSRDLIVPSSKLMMNQTGQLGFRNGKDEFFNLNSWSKSQVAGYCGIPKQYFDRISEENPEILSDMVNHDLARINSESLAKEKQESRMLRTVGPTIRAVVSSRFRRLDAYDLLNETLPVLLDNHFEPISCELTEKRVYVKAVTKRIESEVQKGDIVQYGVMFSTSDVGSGSLKLEPFMYRLVCLNGMIAETKVNQRHTGRNMAEDDVRELLSESTIEMTDKAFFAQVRDILIATMQPEMFEREVNKLRRAAELPIKNFDLENVVDLSMRTTGITGESVKQSIVQQLASGNQGAGLTMWGLANSFTATAKSEAFDYDTSVDLERAGHKIINLNKNQWSRIAEVH